MAPHKLLRIQLLFNLPQSRRGGKAVLRRVDHGTALLPLNQDNVPDIHKAYAFSAFYQQLFQPLLILHDPFKRLGLLLSGKIENPLQCLVHPLHVKGL